MASAIKIWASNDLGMTPGQIDGGGPSGLGWLTTRIVFKAYSTNAGYVYLYDQSMGGGAYRLSANQELEALVDNSNLFLVCGSQANVGLCVYMERQVCAT